MRKPIPGMPGYFITSDGVVFGPRKRRKLWRRPDGYLSFHTSKGAQLVHQCVLIAFVGPRPDGCVACHANGVRHDNRVSNLRWGTHSDNMRDRIAHGTAHIGEAHPGATITTAVVLRIRALAATGVSQRTIAAQFGLDYRHVNLIVLRKRWKHL